MKVFINDPKILRHWEHRYSVSLAQRGVQTIALLVDGLERPNPLVPSSTMRPWSQIVMEDVHHYLRAYNIEDAACDPAKPIFKRYTRISPNGWSLADFTEERAHADKKLAEYDAVLVFSDRRIREAIEKESPGFFNDDGGPDGVPDHEPRGRAEITKNPTRQLGDIVSTNMGGVKAKPIPWLWPGLSANEGRIPRGMLTIFAGSPGVGKSYVSLYVAGRITTGGIWPDVGKEAPLGTVILLAAEDSKEYTIKERLDALGADAYKIEKVEMVRPDQLGDGRSFSLADDIARLEQMARAMDAKLIIIDPVNSYLGGKHDGFKDVEVRRVLDPLKEMAERLDIAVILLMHTKKGIEEELLYQIGGSIAFSAVARNVFFCTRDPETPGRFYFTHPKTVKVESRPLAYTISSEAGVLWGTDEIKLSAREILAAQHQRQKPGPKQTTRLDAHQWLVSFLAGGPQTAADAWADATERGLKPATVRRAMDDLGVLAKPTRLKDGSGQVTGWTWELPTRHHPSSPCANLSVLSI